MTPFPVWFNNMVVFPIFDVTDCLSFMKHKISIILHYPDLFLVYLMHS